MPNQGKARQDKILCVWGTALKLKSGLVTLHTSFQAPYPIYFYFYSLLPEMYRRKFENFIYTLVLN